MREFLSAPIVLYSKNQYTFDMNSETNNAHALASMKGKKGIVMGAANHHSIAWGIARILDMAGASIAFTCGNERFGEKIQEISGELTGSHNTYICDVASDESIANAFTRIKNDFGNIDFLVHSLAFADRKYMSGKYYEVDRKGFAEALDISCYSFTAVTKVASGFMNDGGSVVTMSYYGAEKWIQNYNVMGVAKAALEASIRYLAVDLGGRGIRVNGISAGTIRTLASAGIDDFIRLGANIRNGSPLKRDIDINDVGKTCLYLVSDLSSSVTGEILYVDAGYHVMGVAPVEKD